MGHVKFSAVFMEMVWLFLMRDENDEFAPRVLKFIGVFVASFGEEVGPDGGSHALITNVFSEILKVRVVHKRAMPLLSQFGNFRSHQSCIMFAPESASLSLTS